MSLDPGPAAERGASDGAGVAELLRRVRILEIAARRNAAGLLAGDWVSAIPGRGLLFREPRKYVAGDPARHIDWNITARLGEPYVKVHLEERQREIVIALDVSPSMHVGFGGRTKLELAVEVAATLAASAIDSGDRVGYVVFADEVLDESPPVAGRQQLFPVLDALLRGTSPWTREVAVSDPRVAIHGMQKMTRGRGRLVGFVLSDFLDYDVPEDVKYVQARHDVSFVHVYDPVEYATTVRVRVPAFSPEGDRRGVALRADRSGGGSDGFESARRELRRRCARYRVGVESISTAEPVTPALARLFHLKRCQRTR